MVTLVIEEVTWVTTGSLGGASQWLRVLVGSYPVFGSCSHSDDSSSQ